MSEQLFTATVRGNNDVLVSKCGDGCDKYDIVDSQLPFSSQPIDADDLTDLRPVKVVDVDAVVIELTREEAKYPYTVLVGISPQGVSNLLEDAVINEVKVPLAQWDAWHSTKKNLLHNLAQLSTPAEPGEEQLICPTHKVKDCSCPEWGKFIDARIHEGKTKLVWKSPAHQTTEISSTSISAKCDCEGTEAVTYCKDCGIGVKSKGERIEELRRWHFNGREQHPVDDGCNELEAEIKAIEAEDE